MENDFILMDRLQKIRQIITKYGEDKFYISYSGGKDSNVLSALVDMALPENRIPRVYCNTGIEYRAIVDFVKAKAAADDRFVIVMPKKPIKQTLDEKGYPFKSKMHSEYVDLFHRKGMTKTIRKYLKLDPLIEHYFMKNSCPKSLEYQFKEDDGLDFKISDKCCHELKVGPLDAYQKEHGKTIKMIGIMQAEGGRRSLAGKLQQQSGCLVFANKKDIPNTFKPLYPVTKEWEDWFVKTYNVELPILYYPPYNFDRTGCKGCPFAPNLQQQLDTLLMYFPNEYKQCEKIWAPVYAEYRRLGYRLRKQEEVDPDQTSLFDAKG